MKNPKASVLLTRFLPAIMPALLLAACASGPQKVAQPGQDQATEQRLDDLERRMQRLEGRPPVEMPYRNREEIQAHIQQLEAERVRLLVTLTDQHPAVRNIDRKLRILNEQLQMMKE